MKGNMKIHLTLILIGFLGLLQNGKAQQPEYSVTMANMASDTTIFCPDCIVVDINVTNRALRGKRILATAHEGQLIGYFKNGKITKIKFKKSRIPTNNSFVSNMVFPTAKKCKLCLKGTNVCTDPVEIDCDKIVLRPVE